MPPNPNSLSVPVVLELAPLPREQAGPFLILGLPKTAAREQIEEYWARRVIWARKKQIKAPLEDVNWAREILNDPDKRVLADAGSLNIDTADNTLQQLTRRQDDGGKGATGTNSAARPLDEEKQLIGYAPAVDVPDAEEIRRSITVPDVPREFPAVARLLEQLAREPLDPWEL